MIARCSLVALTLVLQVYERRDWIFRSSDAAVATCPAELASWVRGVHEQQRSTFAVGSADGLGVGDESALYSRIADYSPLAFHNE